MKKFIINPKLVVALLLVAIVLPACSDWLSIAPETKLIKEKFWTKKEDVDGALAATYDSFRDAALESFVWGELRADLAEFVHNNYTDYQSIAASNISPSNSKVNWEKYYQTINLANTLMFYGNEVVDKDDSFTQEMKDKIDSEALFLRAFSYFYLVRLWKQVPLVTEPTITDQDEIFVPKNTEKEVIKQIIADLQQALVHAVSDEYKDNLSYYKGRANVYSIKALLADVYLWDEQYDNAIKYCDEIINTGKFGLVSNNDWFDLYYPGNSMRESLFEIQFDDNYESQENPIHNELMPKSGSSKVSINTDITDLLFNNEDIRLIGSKGPTWKYRGLSDKTSSRRNGAQRDANFIYYRYADLLLIKAEALTEKNMIIEANALIRQTIERAGLSHTDIVSQKDLRKAIMNERAREFIVEGKRWFDLLRNAKRNNFANKKIIIDMILASAEDVKQQAVLRTRVFDTMSYYLPIPEKELLYNPKLIQNPFYDR